jgi:DNA-binding NarL/FixJ family response regulator
MLLRVTLEELGDVEIAGDAADIPETIEQARELQPDVLLLDMLEEAGPDVIPAIHAVAPDTRVIVLSGHPREHSERLRPGAAAYLQKGDPIETVHRVILDG